MLRKLASRSRGAAWRFSKKLSRAGLADFVKCACEQLPPNAEVLSVGAGGDAEAWLRKFGPDFTIVTSDIDPDRVPHVVDDISASMFEDGRFDAVFMIEVLEHVPEFHRAAGELRRVIKPGGRLFLSTPFIFPIHDRPHDYYRFTIYGLAYTFREFTDVHVRARNGWAQAVLVLLARVMSGGRNLQWVGLPFVMLAAIFLPVSLLLERAFRSDFITTGYTLEATRVEADGAASP